MLINNICFDSIKIDDKQLKFVVFEYITGKFVKEHIDIYSICSLEILFLFSFIL